MTLRARSCWSQVRRSISEARETTARNDWSSASNCAAAERSSSNCALDVERDAQVLGNARQRPDHIEVSPGNAGRQYGLGDWRRGVAEPRHDVAGRFVSVDAPIVRRVADRPANIGAALQARQAAAKAAAEPPDDAPGVRERSQGLFVVP